jgi:hypothetical protein
MQCHEMPTRIKPARSGNYLQVITTMDIEPTLSETSLTIRLTAAILVTSSVLIARTAWV